MIMGPGINETYKTQLNAVLYKENVIMPTSLYKVYFYRHTQHSLTLVAL